MKINQRTTALVIFLICSPILLIFYTNMALPDMDLQDLLEESQRVSQVRSNRSLSTKARQVLADHKALVSNMISLKIGAKSCGELLEADPTTRTGKYIFHPEDKSQNSFILDCQISRRQLVSEQFIRVIPDTGMNTACVPTGRARCYNNNYASYTDSCGRRRTLRSIQCNDNEGGSITVPRSTYETRSSSDQSNSQANSSTSQSESREPASEPAPAPKCVPVTRRVVCHSNTSASFRDTCGKSHSFRSINCEEGKSITVPKKVILELGLSLE